MNTMRVSHHTRASTTAMMAIASLTLVACSTGDSDSSSGKSSGSAPGAGAAAVVKSVQKSSAVRSLLPASVVKKGELAFSTNPAYPPTTFKDGDTGKMRGAAIDLTNAVAKKMGVDVSYGSTKGAGYIPAVKAGRFDAGVANIADYTDREKQVDFVDYAKSDFRVVVKAGNPKGIHAIKDFCGKTFASLKGVSSIDLLKAIDKDKCGGNTIKIRQLDTDAEAQLEVASGKSDADMLDAPAAIYSVDHTGGGGKVELVKGLGSLRPFWVGYVVSKKKPKIRQAIQRALQELRKSGEYEKIFKAWNLESMTIDQFPINGAKKNPLKQKY